MSKDITKKARLDLAAIRDVRAIGFRSVEFKAYKSMEWCQTYALPLLEEVAALRAELAKEKP